MLDKGAELYYNNENEIHYQYENLCIKNTEVMPRRQINQNQ